MDDVLAPPADALPREPQLERSDSSRRPPRLSFAFETERGELKVRGGRADGEELEDGGGCASPATEALRSWKAKHPSALDCFEQVAARAAGRRIAVFLDYDGTLTPIVRNPDEAVLPEETRDVVRQIAARFPTAIISGRGRAKVYDFVQVRDIYYAGSHGLDIAGPRPAQQACQGRAGAGGGCGKGGAGGGGSGGGGGGGGGGDAAEEGLLLQPAPWAPALMDELYGKLTAAVESIDGASVEHNTFCVTVHYRCCDPADWQAVADATASAVEPYLDRVRTHEGRKVVEVRPRVEWDKGKALAYLLDNLGLADSTDVLPIYMGDDRTDEDAFAVLRDRGDGLAVLVSSKAKETRAEFTLADPGESLEFLQRVLGLADADGRGIRDFVESHPTAWTE